MIRVRAANWLFSSWKSNKENIVRSMLGTLALSIFFSVLEGVAKHLSVDTTKLGDQ